MNHGGRFLILFFVLSVWSFSAVLAAEPQAAPPAEESQEEIFVARKVEKQPDSKTGNEEANDEPNFIVEGEKVIPNPRKAVNNTVNTASMPAVAAAGSGDSEPNFVSVNGKVIPNPQKAANAANTASAAMPAAADSGDSEPNFVSVNGQVIPNPNKSKAV